MSEDDNTAAAADGDRIAKVLARAGVASRRDAERMIAEGRVKVAGQTLTTPAFKVPAGAIIQVDGKVIAGAEPTRMWRYCKPVGLVTSHRDEKGRPTVFEHLPPGLPRVISVGRLDINSEGLLLLTNDGELARRLELPDTGWIRRYRVRFFGNVEQGELDRLKSGVTVDGVKFGPIEAVLERSKGNNSWAVVSLREGKNREVRKAFEHLGLRVSRLIRVAYGPFQLGDLQENEAEEVSGKVLKEQLGLAKNPNRVGAARGNASRGPGAASGNRADQGEQTKLPSLRERRASPKRESVEPVEAPMIAPPKYETRPRPTKPLGRPPRPVRTDAPTGRAPARPSARPPSRPPSRPSSGPPGRGGRPKR